MKLKFKRKYLIPVFLLLVTLYLFWGPLFPWSPIKPGFKKIESSGATVYITEFNGESEVYKLDDIIEEAEIFHGMRFKEKFRIIILGKESNMKRYLPWLAGSGYSVKLGSINVIYIGAIARNSQYGIVVYLKHEMSHLLIHQNTLSAGNNMEILEQAWLAEGVATYFGGAQYYEKEEFISLWTANDMTFDSLYNENPHDMDKNIIWLKYTYYRFLVEFLIENYGLETKVSLFLKYYISIS